ncbi:MAG: nucleotide exchange factor GrpE [Planctomycetaceae bacterium]
MNDPELQKDPLPSDESPASPSDPQSSGPPSDGAGDPVAAERDEFRDRWMRSQAEFDNYRKRQQRERDDERRYSSGPIVRDLLPVLDNLQRAVAAAEKGGTVEDLRTGVAMVLQQAQEMLAKHQVKPIAAVGQQFDPNLHEALTQLPSADQPPMTVLQDVETGYTLHDRVLRPTKVIVSSGPPNA